MKQKKREKVFFQRRGPIREGWSSDGLSLKDLQLSTEKSQKDIFFSRFFPIIHLIFKYIRKVSQNFTLSVSDLGRCFVDVDTAEECLNGTCVVYMFREGTAKLPDVQLLCVDNSIYSVGLNINVHLDLARKTRDDIYLFRCKYDGCNSIEIIMSIVNVIGKYYDISPMLEIFAFETTSKVKNKTISSTTSVLSSQTTKNFHHLVMIQTALQLSMLVLLQ